VRVKKNRFRIFVGKPHGKTLLGIYRHRQHGYQYSETNVMPFLFNLLRIKGLYKFRHHPGEAN
jgi:hypothetical protein